jgi:aspartate racemase
MKTIGLIGGISWQSSAVYYRLINELVHARLGGHHNARSLMLTVDLDEVFAIQQGADWSELAAMLQACGRHLELAGADCVLICSNTCNKFAPEVAQAISIPVLHIADVTGAAIDRAGFRKVALLGTKYVMEQSFYCDRLTRGRDVEILVPEAASEREQLHRIIVEELVRGILREESRRLYQAAIDALQARGAEAVILGCTEIPLLIQQEHSPMPTLDTTALHAAAAVDWALA